MSSPSQRKTQFEKAGGVEKIQSKASKYKAILEKPGSPFSKETYENNINKHKHLKNTLGALAMAIKGFGKIAGLSIMTLTAGVVVIPAGVMGLAGASLTYGASRMLGVKQDKAVDKAATAAVIAGTTTAMTLSLLAVPFSLGAWMIKQTGSMLMIPAGGKEKEPKIFKKFDDSFSTHIFPLLGRIGKKPEGPSNADSLLAKAGQNVNIKIQKWAKGRFRS